jgi:hypothetical protein
VNLGEVELEIVGLYEGCDACMMMLENEKQYTKLMKHTVSEVGDPALFATTETVHHILHDSGNGLVTTV